MVSERFFDLWMEKSVFGRVFFSFLLKCVFRSRVVMIGLLFGWRGLFEFLIVLDMIWYKFLCCCFWFVFDFVVFILVLMLCNWEIVFLVWMMWIWGMEFMICCFLKDCCWVCLLRVLGEYFFLI